MTIRFVNLRWALLALAACMADAAQAHIGVGAHVHAGIVAGFLHPMTGLDHLLAMFTVGLWAATAQQGNRQWSGPVTFVLALTFGALWPSLGWAMPSSEAAIAVSVVALATLFALGRSAPMALSLGVIAVAGLFHGYAHGVEMGLGWTMLGMVLGSCLLHAMGWVAGRQMKTLPTWVRAASASAIAVGGALMLLARV